MSFLSEAEGLDPTTFCNHLINPSLSACNSNVFLTFYYVYAAASILLSSISFVLLVRAFVKREYSRTMDKVFVLNSMGDMTHGLRCIHVLVWMHGLGGVDSTTVSGSGSYGRVSAIIWMGLYFSFLINCVRNVGNFFFEAQNQVGEANLTPKARLAAKIFSISCSIAVLAVSIIGVTTNNKKTLMICHVLLPVITASAYIMTAFSLKYFIASLQSVVNKQVKSGDPRLFSSIAPQVALGLAIRSKRLNTGNNMLDETPEENATEATERAPSPLPALVAPAPDAAKPESNWRRFSLTRSMPGGLKVPKAKSTPEPNPIQKTMEHGLKTANILIGFSFAVSLLEFLDLIVEKNIGWQIAAASFDFISYIFILRGYYDHFYLQNISKSPRGSSGGHPSMSYANQQGEWNPSI